MTKLVAILCHPMYNNNGMLDVGRSPSREDGADTFRGESRPLVYPLPLSPGGTTQWWHRARDILTVMSPPQCYIPIAFSHDNNAYGLALHAYKYDIAHDHVHGLTPALMCLIRHLGRVSGQGPSITFEDWRDATPPPPWRDTRSRLVMPGGKTTQ